MKKFAVVLIIILCLCGCSATNTNKETITNDDFVLSDTNITSKGIMVGSTGGEFQTAYSDYDIAVGVMYDDNSSNKTQETTINKVDYSKSCRVYLSGISIDDKCISTKQFMKQNNIIDGIDKWFSDNKDYLDKHTAVYKCLIFSFSDGAVSNIESYEKNYNEEK